MVSMMDELPNEKRETKMSGLLREFLRSISKEKEPFGDLRDEELAELAAVGDLAVNEASARQERRRERVEEIRHQKIEEARFDGMHCGIVLLGSSLPKPPTRSFPTPGRCGFGVRFGLPGMLLLSVSP